MNKSSAGQGRLPDFFVVGAQKCGTTSLHSYLNSHPGICLPSGKETKFFADDERYQKGIEHYLGQWDDLATPDQLVGEVDPDYMYFEPALERIADVLDVRKTKFIFIFREPVARAFSHYLMTFRRGIEQLDFEHAIAAEPERITKGFHERLHFSYLDRGHYYRQVSRFLDKVDRKNVLFILSEDLSERTEEVMTEVFTFLGLHSRLEVQLSEREHKGTAPRSPRLLRAIVSQGAHKEVIRLMLPFPVWRKKLRQKILNWNETENISITLSEDTNAKLKNLFCEENQKLSSLIGRDLGHWN